MSIFITLLLKLLPLYCVLLLGVLAGRYFRISKESISSLLMYVIYPVVVFTGVASTPLTFSTLSLPLLVFVIACVLCLAFYTIGKRLWPDSTANLLAFSAGNANTGYFGLPVALALFGEANIGVYVLCIMGITLYENTLGFFMTARGRNTPRESLKKLIHMPTLYALVAGIAVSLMNVPLPEVFFETTTSFRAALTLLGMIVIGISLSAARRCPIDFKFVSLAFVAKFAAWPLLVGLAVLLDMHLLHLYDTIIHKALLLMSFTPLAAHTVVFAAELKTQPDKAACAVSMSILFALVYIPVMSFLFLM